MKRIFSGAHHQPLHLGGIIWARCELVGYRASRAFSASFTSRHTLQQDPKAMGIEDA